MALTVTEGGHCADTVVRRRGRRRREAKRRTRRVLRRTSVSKFENEWGVDWSGTSWPPLVPCARDAYHQGVESEVADESALRRGAVEGWYGYEAEEGTDSGVADVLMSLLVLPLKLFEGGERCELRDSREGGGEGTRGPFEAGRKWERVQGGAESLVRCSTASTTEQAGSR